MSKRASSKGKICKTVGVDLWGVYGGVNASGPFGGAQSGSDSADAPAAGTKVKHRWHRTIVLGRTPPGKRPKALTAYGTLLRGKQMLRGFYGNFPEKQFQGLYMKAKKARGNTAALFAGFLESRLDIVLWRSGFVSTVFQGRQRVNHGHFTVNGRVVHTGGYLLKPGDLVQCRNPGTLDSSPESEVSQETPGKLGSLTLAPQWGRHLLVNAPAASLVFLNRPSLEEGMYPFVGGGKNSPYASVWDFYNDVIDFYNRH